MKTDFKQLADSMFAKYVEKYDDSNKFRFACDHVRKEAELLAEWAGCEPNEILSAALNMLIYLERRKSDENRS